MPKTVPVVAAIIAVLALATPSLAVSQALDSKVQAQVVEVEVARALAPLPLILEAVPRATLELVAAPPAPQFAPSQGHDHRAPPPAPHTHLQQGLNWAALRGCESGGRNVNTGNGYYGYYQFDRATFRGVTGLPGVASDYSLEVQSQAAQKLYNQRGRQPWPQCGKLL